MPRAKAEKIVKEFAKKLKENDYYFSEIYLFGSYAKGKQKKDSDIDVAVISDKLKRNYDRNRFLLWKIRMGVDTKIEPHGFTKAEFKNNCSPIVYEIKKTGIKIV
ncbi:MAG: nucleotidyltransferase domain-containing protein [bacterium]